MSHTAQTTLSNTIRTVLNRARTDHESTLDDDTVDDLVTEAERSLYEGADDDEIYEGILHVLTARIERYPEYKQVAANVFRQQYYREVIGEDLEGFDLDRAYRDTFRENIARGVDLGLLDDRMGDLFDLEELASYLEPERDEHFEYMALDTLYQRYFLKTADGERLELPQAMWMRVAMGLALEEDDPQARTKEFYDVLSRLEFTPSSPTLFHSGTAHAQLSSCYLTTIPDDLEGIFDAISPTPSSRSGAAASATTGRTSARRARSSVRPASNRPARCRSFEFRTMSPRRSTARASAAGPPVATSSAGTSISRRLSI